jgi:hypothetical protein
MFGLDILGSKLIMRTWALFFELMEPGILNKQLLSDTVALCDGSDLPLDKYHPANLMNFVETCSIPASSLIFSNTGASIGM